MTSLPTSREAEIREGVLRLEYALTPAERSEAQSLILRRQVGGGSKWLTGIVLSLGLVAMLLGLCAMITREVDKARQPYMIAAFVGLTAVVFVLRRRLRKRVDSAPPVVVELSADGIRFLSDQSHTVIPWKAILRRMESDTLLLLQHRSNTVCYIFPKRAFPTPECVNWLREINLEAGGQPDATDTGDAAAVPNHDRSTVSLDVRLNLWNWFDWSLASWALGRGVTIFWTGMLIGCWIAVSLAPNPNAKLTNGQVFIYAVLPASVVGSAVLVTFFTTYSWFTHRKEHGRHTISLGEESVSVATKDGAGTLSWTTFTRYKETPWSFLVWNNSPGNWLMLPKSAFPSIKALEDCRELLARRLRRSTWFFGH